MSFMDPVASRFSPPRRMRIDHARVAHSLDLIEDESSTSECSEQEFDLSLNSGDEENWPDDVVRRLGDEHPLKCSAIWVRHVCSLSSLMVSTFRSLAFAFRFVLGSSLCCSQARPVPTTPNLVPPEGFKASPTMIVSFGALFPPPTDGLIMIGLSVSEGAFLISLTARLAQ